MKKTQLSKPREFPQIYQVSIRFKTHQPGEALVNKRRRDFYGGIKYPESQYIIFELQSSLPHPLTIAQKSRLQTKQKPPNKVKLTRKGKRKGSPEMKIMTTTRTRPSIEVVFFSFLCIFISFLNPV